jgi:hypothetical protein
MELHPEHLADLKKSGLSPAMLLEQKVRTIPPSMIGKLLGFDPPGVRHAYLIPFADPYGRWMDHVRARVFRAFYDPEARHAKYLQPRDSGVRLFYPLATLDSVLHSDAPLFAVEGEKKALSVAQLGRPTIGICGIEGWHARGERTLHADFTPIPLAGRVVEIVPDGDVRTNSAVERATARFAAALEARGARVRIIVLPLSAEAA